MLILGRDQLKDASLGYARTFARQVEDCLGLALERGVKIVSNAGGLNPAGLAARARRDRERAGPRPDDRLRRRRRRPRRLGFGGALTANAYLGGFGIAAALRDGADVVVTGRVTDASLVVGPAVAHFGWERHGVRRAGRRGGRRTRARVRHPGHRRELLRASTDLPAIGSTAGLPVAELSADGSSVITKHDDTGGLVSVDTVTAQLMYEVQSTRYLGPDVTTHLDTITLSRRRARPGARSPGSAGSAPPERLKVCVNELGGSPQLRGVRADRPRHRGEGRLGARPARAPADRGVGHLGARTAPRGRRRHRGGGLHPAALHGPGPVAPTPSAARSAAPRSSSRSRPTPASR